MHLSYTAPHGPFQALKSYYDELSHIKDENKRVYYAMIKSMDDGIGQVMEKLKELNLDENRRNIDFSSKFSQKSYEGEQVFNLLEKGTEN